MKGAGEVQSHFIIIEWLEGKFFELQVTQVKKLSLQSFSWVLPYSQANNHLPLIQFIRKSCLLYIYNTPKFQPFLTFSTTVERTPEWSLKCTSFQCYSFAQNLPVTRCTESKTANPNVGLERAVLWPTVTSFLFHYPSLWLLHSFHTGLLAVP